MTERSKVPSKAASRDQGSGFFDAESQAMITIHLNGEPYRLEEAVAVAALLERLALKATRVAVEVNRAVVPKARYADTRLGDGDQVEIINFVGGG